MTLSTEEIKIAIKALKKPLRMWPGLYAILSPIRKLMVPTEPFEWGEEQSEALTQARKYILQELSQDTDDESDSRSGSGTKEQCELRGLTGADLQNLGVASTKPKKFMTPGAMSDETRGDTTLASGVIMDWPCRPPPSHHFCRVPLTPGGVNPPNHGMTEEMMESLGLTPPITARIYVRDLAYGVDEAKLREVFSLCGKVVEFVLYRHDDGETKGKGTIEFAHPLEAVQAFLMFKDTKLYSRQLTIRQDRKGPRPAISDRLPDGLVNVGNGIGLNGSRLKVEYLNGDAVIHHPDCHNQGSHPISEKEKDQLPKEGSLGGVVRLSSVYHARNWPDTTISQLFADTMYDKLQHLVTAGENCITRNMPQTPQIRELLRIAQGIQDEFATRITRRDSWVKHGDSDTDTDTESTETTAYLGTQYQVDLRKPRTENEHQSLINQLDSLSNHFNDLKQHLAELRHRKNSIFGEGTSMRDGDSRKEIWTDRQAAVFEDLKTLLFQIVQGGHIWTRDSRIEAYHPDVNRPPGVSVTCKIIIQATFGEEDRHIMILKGHAWDRKFRDVAFSLLGEQCESCRKKPSGNSKVVSREIRHQNKEMGVHCNEHSNTGRGALEVIEKTLSSNALKNRRRRQRRVQREFNAGGDPPDRSRQPQAQPTCDTCVDVPGYRTQTSLSAARPCKEVAPTNAKEAETTASH